MQNAEASRSGVARAPRRMRRERWWRAVAEIAGPPLGVVLALNHEDYKFGSGPMLCRVRTVLALVYFDNVPWWHVAGACANGTVENHGGWHDRELYIVGAIAAARAHSGSTRKR